MVSPGPWALPGEGSEHRARLIQAVARKQQPLDLQAVAGPVLHFEEVVPIGNQVI